MELTRKNVTVGIAGLGLIGVLAGGIGVAAATTGSAGAPTPSPSTSACPYAGMPGMGFGMRGMHGMADWADSPITAAAGYLGLSETDLQAQLRAGKSLADVAKAQGKSVAGLKDAMVAAMKKNLDASTTLSADQKAAMLAQMKSHIDTMVDTAHISGAGSGHMGGHMGGMMR